MANDVYQNIGYGDGHIGYGRQPAILVVDFQRAVTDPEMEFGNCALVQRAVKNTAVLLELARSANIPIANCYTAYHSDRDMPHWKIEPVRRTLFHGQPEAEIEPRTSNAKYDFIFSKSAPSIFFNTPCTTLLTKNAVDTVIITGCMTSGCVRASVVDAFSHGYRTIVPEDCVGDAEEGPHLDNLRDVGRRYSDIIKLSDALNYIDDFRKRNS